MPKSARNLSSAVQTCTENIQIPKQNMVHMFTAGQPKCLLPKQTMTGVFMAQGSGQFPLSAARMVLRVELFEALARHVRIDGGGGNVRVPQQQLHHAQVGAVVEQMRGKGMAQRVW